jgi:AcrR family transcriptional regulator
LWYTPLGNQQIPAFAAMSTATPTRQRLIEAAGRRFYRDGFRMVGLDQILAEVGISKTAFYKHFESKDDLVLAALAEHDREMQDTFRQLVRERGGPTPLGQLAVVMDVVEHFVASEDFQGCIFVNVAMEFPLPHEPAHIAAANSKRAVEEIVHELAVEAGAADPRALAKELCLIMEGAYVTRHVTGDRDAVAIARRLADLAIAAQCPAVSEARS